MAHGGWSKAFTASDAIAYDSAGLKTGSVLGGRYEILQMLGEGGMGAVYKAHDAEVDRIVALKVIRPDLAGGEDILRRFRRELVLARQITNRNVVRIYDLGVADGVRFISMEYIEGQELTDLLRTRGKLPPKEAAGIMLQVLPRAGSGSQRRHCSSRSQAAERHDRQTGTRSSNGFWYRALCGRGRRRSPAVRCA